MSEKIVVSVCLPLFNGEEYLHDALLSLKAQTYKHIELIVSDDDSYDNSLRIIEAFKKNVSFPIHVHNHKPSGIGANWNNCIKYANGKFICFLFQDDVFDPEFIEKSVTEIQKNNKTGLVYCKRNFVYQSNNEKHINWINEYGELHRFWKNTTINNKQIVNGRELLKDKNLFKNPMNKIGEPTAVMIRKEVFNKIGFFSTELKQTLDLEFWYRTMKYYHVVFIDEPLIYFRLHENQASNINSKSNNNKEIERLFKSFRKNIFWCLSFNNKVLLLTNNNKVKFFIKSILRKLK
jgi:glycosyltransferase involved in cell wall biosynthesis